MNFGMPGGRGFDQMLRGQGQGRTEEVTLADK